LELLWKVAKSSLGIKHSGGVIESSADQLFIGQTGEGIVSRQGMATLAAINAGHADGGGISGDSMVRGRPPKKPGWAGLEGYVPPELPDDATDEQRKAADLEQKRHDLELAFMDAAGNKSGNLAQKRADEIAQMDESLRGLQEKIYLEEDYNTRRDQEITLMEKQGKGYEVLWAKRDLELLGMSKDEQQRQRLIYAAEDQVKTQDLQNELMKAQGKTTEALAISRKKELENLSGIDRAIQKQIWAQELQNDHRKLDIDLMEAQGNATGALAAKREDELKALDPTLRGIKAQIWAAQDAAKLENSRRSLEIDLMNAQGDATGALAAKREDELKALDPSLRALKQQIYATEDAKTAEDALTKSREAALDKIKDTDFSTKYEYLRARAMINVRGYDSGGYHPGGLRVVGESGPEIEWTGASRIFSNQESKGLVSNGEVVSAIRVLRDDLVQLGIQNVVANGKTAKVLTQWNGRGLPDSQSNLTTFGN
jgi:hypothetical protein